MSEHRSAAEERSSINTADLFAEGEVPALGPEDDGFHTPSDHEWETETAWFSFNVPARRMGGWLYNQVLANQGVCNGGAWVWDDSPTGSLYERNQQGLPMPAKADLRDITLPNGNSIAVLEPLQRYRVRYADPGRFDADLEFDAVMAPNSHPLGVAPFWKGRHFDQAGRVTGSIVLDGETIDIDCLSVRDRSWGPRPRGPGKGKVGVGYSFGTASSDDAFLAYTVPMVGSDDVSTGYLIRGGEYAHLVEGRRVVEFDPDNRWITRIRLEATDELGRRLDAAGELVSHHGAAGPSGTGLFFWEWNGASGWGEDQSYASDEIWQSLGLEAEKADEANV
jgi:hypothetical protein